jgi:glycosidase/PKD repeat protein
MHTALRRLLVLVLVTLVAGFGFGLEKPALAVEPPSATINTGTDWCAAGSFQGWDNASDPMVDDGTGGDLIAGDGVYTAEFTISAAGRHEWKTVACGDWGTAFPGNNSWFFTGVVDQVVRLTFDSNDHGGDAGVPYSPAANIVDAAGDTEPAGFTAVGDWQGWNNADPTTAREALGNGIWRLKIAIPTAGGYQAKIVPTGSWGEQFVADGRAIDGSPVGFTTSVDGEEVIFLLDTRSSRWSVQSNGASAGDWCLAGGFQGWDNASDPLFDDGTNGDLLGGDGVFTLDYTVAAAGRYEFKVVACGDWGTAFPSQNSWVYTTSDNQVVKFTFDTNDHSGDILQLVPQQNIVNAWDSPPTAYTAVGDWQGWDNGNAATGMTAVGDGLYLLDYEIATGGVYQAKIVQTGSWTEQFVIDGRAIDGTPHGFQTLADNLNVTFLMDVVTGRWNAYPAEPAGGAGHDNNIFWDDLGHDSRDGIYRTPRGPVPTGAEVTLRLRAAAGDLTEARLRLWNDRTNAQSLVPMALVENDGTYEWWEATVPASADPTVYWYRFIAVDGTATAYYEDDAARTGGWGQTFGESQDNSWQLTVYDPSFQTPDWVKDAVIYQIFTDRFRDGNPSNNTPAGTFFYDEPGGTVVRSLDPEGDWNTIVCDPREDGTDCSGTYSKNFYGGDLQGIVDRLDYLQDLGITALYLNPIFESPSNHKYDTTDFTIIDDNFGDMVLFQTLVTEANNRGINVILDGVFNHTSSDSLYFDRYERYAPPDGACESESSLYRDWYFFSPAAVPGTGVCAGDTTYESWFGFDSLPKLDSANTNVRDEFWANGVASIAPYWMQWADGWRLDVGGDVDPGTINDPTNDYWEGFRAAVRAVNPDAYIVGEEWGNASSWVLGDEWDATMNYQYGSAMLSFWRDTAFVDNDHNAGSSAGTLTPLSPSALNERLLNWQERYPPEAYYAMMNLLGSHDTNRALIMLDEGPGADDPSQWLDPTYDWNDAMDRLKGVTVLQFTLPGAPTVYYGDEVGLVQPAYSDGSTLQDDPYNRIPYPWLDESGTPFYTHLQTAGGQADMRDHYALLAAARNAHPALRTGSFDPLLVDDGAGLYGYGRLLPDYSDAAVVVVNQSDTAAPGTVLDVAGYLPAGAVFADVLNGGAYTVTVSGELAVDVPAFSGAVLVAEGQLSSPPVAVNDLAATAVSYDAVDLSWSAAADADSYDIYRSPVSGGGYAFLANTPGTTYNDAGLTVANDYYYVVVSRDDTTLLTSGFSNEASATPAYAIGWANLQWPPTINHTISAVNPTDNIYGQIWIDGVTSVPGATPGLQAQVGYGPDTTPAGPDWVWYAMAFNADAGNNDEYAGNLLPDQLGVFCYTTRYSGDGGATWFYAVNGPDEGNPTCPGPFGVLTVVPSADTTAPTAPTNLAVAGTTAASVSLTWDVHPNTDGDLVGFELYRENIAAPGYGRIATISNPAATGYTDTAVTTGETYNYYLLAFDTSYNRSVGSNVVQATAEPRLVAVTFRVGVPDYTPGVVYIAGDLPEFGPWNPGLVPMAEVSPAVWEYTLDVLDGTTVQYKFTRGSWDTVESWGSIVGLANRSMTVDYGSDGTQLVDMTATDWGNGDDSTKAVQFWRDPIVVDFLPEAGAFGLPLTTTVEASFSISVTVDTQFDVSDAVGTVSGTFAYDAGNWRVTFTPDAPLQPSTVHTVTIEGAQTNGVPGGDSGTQQVPAIWQFTTGAPVTGLAAVNDGPTVFGETTAFTATVTAGSDLVYVWDFGDGFGDVGQMVAHTYADPGTYTTTVTAENAFSQATAMTVVSVQIPASGVSLVTDAPTALGSATTFTATTAAGTGLVFDWDFGDGTRSLGADAVVISHTYATPGAYTATVTVSNGVSSVSVGEAVLVQAPVLDLTATNDGPTALGSATMLSATVSAGTGLIYTWDFGDGSGGAGPLVSHTYAAAGVYTATVTAANDVSSAMAETVVIVEEPTSVDLVAFGDGGAGGNFWAAWIGFMLIISSLCLGGLVALWRRGALRLTWRR